MNDRQFWSRTPIYIVMCVLLGFVIAGLLAQNTQLKNDLNEVKTEQRDQQAKTQDVLDQADRIIAYLRCISLTPVGERTEELVNKCLEQDLPAQPSNGSPQASSGSSGSSFLAPAPSSGAQPQANGNSNNQPVDKSPNNVDNPTNENSNSGLLDPVKNPLCTNLTPRICATLGL